MNTPQKVPWRITDEAVGSCNCAWGCPCQFNALPTHGRCEGIGGHQIQEGHFGATRLDGVRFAQIFWWPGPIHEGNGTRQLVIDEQATPDQRDALIAMADGIHGGAVFEIFATMSPNVVAPVFAHILFESDRERGQGLLRIPGLVEVRAEPIKNPVTGEEHRAQIVLPGGFEFKEAEMGNAVVLQAQSDDPLVFEHTNTYAQLNAFDWSNEDS